MTIAVLPGSYDPITHGHLDIAARASTMFDEVIIAVAHNSTKTPLLSVETRVELARESVAHLDGVRVEVVEGLLVEFCEEEGATAIVKGLRGGSDYDFELPMALMNRSLAGVETIFVIGDNALSHIASSLVRDIARHGGDFTKYVPAPVVPAVRRAVEAKILEA